MYCANGSHVMSGAYYNQQVEHQAIVVISIGCIYWSVTLHTYTIIPVREIPILAAWWESL